MAYYYNDRLIREGRSWTDADGIQHPTNWANWSAEEKADRGLVWVDDPAPFDNRFYWDAETPKDLEDKDAVDENGDPVLDEDGEQVVIKGLKTRAIERVKNQANGLLEPTDWLIVRQAEGEKDAPTEVLTYRSSVRAKSAEIEATIAETTTLDEFIALHQTPVDENGDPTGNPPITDWPENSDK